MQSRSLVHIILRNSGFFVGRGDIDRVIAACEDDASDVRVVAENLGLDRESGNKKKLDAFDFGKGADPANVKHLNNAAVWIARNFVIDQASGELVDRLVDGLLSDALKARRAVIGFRNRMGHVLITAEKLIHTMWTFGLV